MAGIKRRAFAGDHVTDAEVDSFNSILDDEIGCSLKFSLSGNGSGSRCDLVHMQAPAFSCKAALCRTDPDGKGRQGQDRFQLPHRTVSVAG